MQTEVRYIDHGVEHVGAYRVDGWVLELTCVYGRRRAALGLFEPKVLARKLLRGLVAKAQNEVRAVVPQAAMIVMSRSGARPVAGKH